MKKKEFIEYKKASHIMEKIPIENIVEVELKKDRIDRSNNFEATGLQRCRI